MKALLLVGMVVVSASLALAESTNVVAVKAQATCPVMGGAVSRKVFVDYQGQRIYFCCKGCPEAFNKEPEKYLKKLKEQGVTLEKAAK